MDVFGFLSRQRLIVHELAIHHGTVQLTDEAIDQPVIDHEIALEKHGVAADAFRAIEAGESWSIPPLATTRQTMLDTAAE